MEQIRAPFSIIWTIMSPTVLFFFLHFNEIEQHFGDTLWLKHQISWFVGYISFSVVLFNYCLYLTGRRESGFIATFVHSIEGRLLFIRSQLMASLIMSVMYVLFFIKVVFIGIHARPDYQTVILILKTICINVMMMIRETPLLFSHNHFYDFKTGGFNFHRIFYIAHNRPTLLAIILTMFSSNPILSKN